MLQDTSHHGKASSSSRRLLLAFELLLGVTLLVSCVRVARTGALIWILTVGLEIAVILMLELFRTSAYREAPMSPREEDVQTAVQSEAAIETKAEVKADDTGTLAEQADSSVVPGEGKAGRVTPHEPIQAPKTLDTHDDHATDEGTMTSKHSQLDLDSLSARITETDDPIAELKLFVGDIRTRMAGGTPDHGKGKSSLSLTVDEAPQHIVHPSGIERFAARVLTEAGLFEDDVELPPLKAVMLNRSSLFYLRIGSKSIPYLARLRVIKLEAALNQIRFATQYLNPRASEQECFELNWLMLNHICVQAGTLDKSLKALEDDIPDSEWSSRRQIATALETLVLPYRLEANFRVNIADGNVSIEFAATPEQVFPSSMPLNGLGIVLSSREVRKRAASVYIQRLAILLAAIAFRSSSKILHVWVAATLDTANRHQCYLSVDFDRWRFSQIDVEKDMDDTGNFNRVYHRFVPAMRIERGILRPVKQTFRLEEPRFCPPRRYEALSLSSRRIPKVQAEALGCDHVYDLAIEEADKRNYVAIDIMRRLVFDKSDEGSTEKNVRMILDVAGDDPDLSVRSAAERCVQGLIDGTIPEEPFAIGEEFANGDALSKAAERAHEQLDRKDPAGAIITLKAALADVDGHDLFADSRGIEWRYFGNYVDRALYNRLYGASETSVMLVPDSYFECHLMLSAAYEAQGRHEAACRHAKRTVELAPLDRRAHLHLVHCLEVAGDSEGAIEGLNRLLSTAHDPEGLGIGYYRMAFFQWQKGNILAAEACYKSSLGVLRGSFPMAATELATLAMQHPETFREDMSQEEMISILTDADIPIAPTEPIADAFLSCMKASVNAEVFPVARNFVSILAGLYPDDVVFGILRSLETEPDA